VSIHRTQTIKKKKCIPTTTQLDFSGSQNDKNHLKLKDQSRNASKEKEAAGLFPVISNYEQETVTKYRGIYLKIIIIIVIAKTKPFSNGWIFLFGQVCTRAKDRIPDT